MSQPTTYVRAFNFTNQQAVTPTDPLPADKVDLELNLVKTSLDETQANLALIQRDDGALGNATVGIDQFKAEVDIGFNPPSEWLPETNYILRDTVFKVGGFYRCAISHISGDFAADLSAGRWELIADFVEATTEAAASAASALASKNAAEASETQTGLDAAATAADRVATGQDATATATSAAAAAVSADLAETRRYDAEVQSDAAAVSAAQSLSYSGISEGGAATALGAAQDAQDLLQQATAGFVGFIEGSSYDFGSVATSITYFDQDFGSIV